jgi:hypothetical protein
VSTGVVRGLTVLVEFQDVTTTITKQDVEEMLNAPNYTKNGNFCSAPRLLPARLQRQTGLQQRRRWSSQAQS